MDPHSSTQKVFIFLREMIEIAAEPLVNKRPLAEYGASCHRIKERHLCFNNTNNKTESTKTQP